MKLTNATTYTLVLTNEEFEVLRNAMSILYEYGDTDHGDWKMIEELHRRFYERE